MVPFEVESEENVHDRLAAALSEHRLELTELPDDTGTADLAANALRVTPKQIVKSLLLFADGEPVMVLAAGDRQVDLTHLASVIGVDELRMARASEVKEVTGFAIGGVPPFGHRRILRTFLDRRLLDDEVVYAAAGTRFRVFAVDPGALLALSQARVVWTAPLS